MSIKLTLAALLAGATLCVASPFTGFAQTRAPTLALTNGHIVTVDSTKPEAQAIAVAGDRIIAVGSNAEIRRLITPATKVIDLQGMLVTPGIIEGHGHFTSLGTAKLQLDLTKAQ